jgi:tRNA(Ile)-lysidine synthase
MAGLLKSFRDFVEREQLFNKEDKLLLACSAGLDSTVLAHLLHAEGYNFAIAHMNFQLRGEASNDDAAFVEELARTLGARFFIKAVDVKKEAHPGESTQMTARWLRYNWFREVLDEYTFDRILTAHHLDDNFETVMMNFIRSTGITGMSGMDPRFGYLARPLLNCSRQTIQEYAEAKEISWREDISNASDDYLRNRIRHHLMPVFRDTFEMSDKTIAGNILNLRGGESFYFMGLEAERDKRRKVRGEVVTISREYDWTFATVRAFLHRAIMPYYGFTTDQIDQICSLPDNRFLDSKKFRIFVMPNKWVISPLSTVNRLAGKAITELPLVINEGYHKLIFSSEKRPSSLEDEHYQYLAPQALPLHLRPRQNGDRFQPFGMGGKSKKVKDYMIDQKIPVWLRDRIYLLCNADDEIMAIPGYCISEKFKVLPEHETVLRISWS